MVKIFLKKRACYPVKRSVVRETIENYLLGKKIKQDVEICVSIVGSRKMRDLNKKYRRKNEDAVVLSFPCVEMNRGKPFIFPPDSVLRLGDIVISYPQLRDLARDEKKLIDEKTRELVFHGLRCLVEGEKDTYGV